MHLCPEKLRNMRTFMLCENEKCAACHRKYAPKTNLTLTSDFSAFRHLFAMIERRVVFETVRGQLQRE